MPVLAAVKPARLDKITGKNDGKNTLLGQAPNAENTNNIRGLQGSQNSSSFNYSDARDTRKQYSCIWYI